MERAMDHAMRAGWRAGWRAGGIGILFVGLLSGLSACASDPDVDFKMTETGGSQTDAIDEVLSELDKDDIEFARMSSLVAQKGSPEAGVRYFKDLIEKDPDNLTHLRGLALALSHARRHDDAARIWRTVLEKGGDQVQDRFGHLRALARARRWDEAAEQLAEIGESAPWTLRDRLFAAVVLDNTGQWAAADVAYSRALSGAERPAQILNNWGVSKMGRGDYFAAAQLFNQALAIEETLTVAKVNLTLASALQGDFSLPSITMGEIERAHLYHDVGLIALRRGDRETARRLFRAAVDQHPRHYRKAADRLAELDGPPPKRTSLP